MSRPPAPLRRLLAALLLLQVVLGPSLCLARADHSAATLVEICTAEGLKRVALADDGSGEAPAHGAHDGFCAVCHGLPQAAALAAPILPPPAWALAPARWDSASLAAPPPAIRGPPGGARAPPSLLS